MFCQAEPCKAENDRLFGEGGHVQLMSDRDVRELMFYARSIGLPLAWAQHQPIPHFNLAGKFLKRVMEDARVAKLQRERFIERCRLVERNMAGQ